jgi:hypothetical protein
VIVAQFKLLGRSSGVRPKRFDDFRGDIFLAGISFPPVLRNVTRHAPSIDGGSKANVPIVATWRRLVKIEVPRCAPNWDE